jgi:hypothetical protein
LALGLGLGASGGLPAASRSANFALDWARLASCFARFSGSAESPIGPECARLFRDAGGVSRLPATHRGALQSLAAVPKRAISRSAQVQLQMVVGDLGEVLPYRYQTDRVHRAIGWYAKPAPGYDASRARNVERAL